MPAQQAALQTFPRPTRLANQPLAQDAIAKRPSAPDGLDVHRYRECPLPNKGDKFMRMPTASAQRPSGDHAEGASSMIQRLKYPLGAALAAFALSGQAAVVNGDFELGLDGWTVSGVTAAIGPGGGGTSQQAYLDTSPFDSDVAQTSSISQTFTGSGTISFWWNFLTNEELGGAINDAAFVVLDGVSTKLADVFSAFTTSTLGGYADMTGYQYMEMSLGFAGEHTISFMVSDDLDGWVDSALLIDNVSVRAGAIPEPAALSLVSLGLLGMGFLRRRSTASA